jgi:TRAP-type C4-dicarboxylate transport system substrate-binding protein
VVHAVAADDADLGWVGTRVFDTLGDQSFEALTAPMLIDSYALEGAVIESGITGEMMDGLDGLGVAGLAVLADALRRPVSVRAPLLRPADWRGLAVGTLMSRAQVAALRALGARPAQLLGDQREAALTDGSIQAFEFGLWQYVDPKWSRRAPYVAANVALWPQMDVLLASPDSLARLTERQRGWLRQAADDAANRSPALADKDARAIDIACQGGSRFATATEADLQALRAAFEPAYAELEQRPRTKAFIARIRALKLATAHERAPAIPSGCTGTAPPRGGGMGGERVTDELDGTYRYVLTRADAVAAGEIDPEDEYPLVNTIVLEDGRLEGGCFGADGGSYAVEADRIRFHSIEYGYDMTVRFARAGDGDLTLEPLPPMDPGDRFQCFSRRWTRIR